MITLDNYFSKKKDIDFSLVDEKFMIELNEIENIISSINEIPELKEDENVIAITDEFFKNINKQFKTTKKAATSKTTKPTSSRKKHDCDEDEKRLTTREQIYNTKYFKKLVPASQQQYLKKINSEEFDKTLIEVEKQLAEIPKASQGANTLMENKVYAHYWMGSTHWYVFDIDKSGKEFFGYTILNGDMINAEAGYIAVEQVTTFEGIQLDFHFKRESLEAVLQKRFPEHFSKPEKKEDTIAKTNNTPVKKQAIKTKIPKVVHIKMVDHLSIEYRLIRRFYNLITKNKTVSFRRIQLVYMAFQKAALDRSIRKTSKDADLFTKVNKKVVLLFDKVNPNKDDAAINIKDQKLIETMEAFIKEQKVNYAITLLKSFIGMQGHKPDRNRATNLLKRVNSAIEKQKVTKKNRLYQDLVTIKMELENYLANSKKKIQPKLIGLSKPILYNGVDTIKKKWCSQYCNYSGRR